MYRQVDAEDRMWKLKNDVIVSDSRAGHVTYLEKKH